MKAKHPTKKIFQFVVLSASFIGTTAYSQAIFPSITGDPRVDKLLSQMSLEEKISLIHGETEDHSTTQWSARQILYQWECDKLA